MPLGLFDWLDVLSSNLVNLTGTSWFNIITFFGLWTTIWLPIAFFVARLVNWQSSEPLTSQQKLALLGSLYLIVPPIVWFRVERESLSLTDLGLSYGSDSFWYILLGLAVSSLGLLVIFSLETASKLIDWHWHNLSEVPQLVLPILSLSLVISLVEEVVFRGYVFATLRTDNSLWWAAIASSLIFAALHLVWERKQTLPQLPGLFLMGVVLVLARVLVGDRIYFAIGLHAGWIWGLTCIDSANLLSYKYSDHWFTGIKQQPLAGLGGILCILVTGFAVWSASGSQLLF